MDHQISTINTYETQSMLENPNYTLYYERSLITDHTIHNNCLDVVLFDKTAKEAHLRDAEISNSHTTFTAQSQRSSTSI